MFPIIDIKSRVENFGHTQVITDISTMSMEEKMEQPKKGFFTSEFWVTAVAGILAVVVAAGYLGQQEATEINNATVTFINASFELVKVLAPVISAAVYTWSRTKVKTAK